MVEFITVADLPAAIQSTELVADMVAGANAKASRVAPCLTWDGTVTGQPAPTADQIAETRLVLLGAVKRWAEAGAGAFQSQNAGPFGVTVDTRQRTGFNLWPSEISALQDICSSGRTTGAFSIRPSGCGGGHMDICSANRYVDAQGNVVFGGAWCSCGSDINGYAGPLYEGGILSGDDY